MVVTPVGGVVEALRIGVGFLWTATWAIVLGLVVTSFVQVYVSKVRMARVLGEEDAGAIGNVVARLTARRTRTTDAIVLPADVPLGFASRPR